MTDKIESLQRLAKLADEGRISNSEYATLKAELLGEQVQAEPRPNAQAPIRPTAAPTRHEAGDEVVMASRPKDWRFWVGLALSGLGVLAVVAGFVRFSNEPIQSVYVFVMNFLLDPLIWGGLIGTTLLQAWKQSTD